VGRRASDTGAGWDRADPPPALIAAGTLPILLPLSAPACVRSRNYGGRWPGGENTRTCSGTSARNAAHLGELQADTRCPATTARCLPDPGAVDDRPIIISCPDAEPSCSATIRCRTSDGTSGGTR
jgi:hypothetical protein